MSACSTVVPFDSLRQLLLLAFYPVVARSLFITFSGESSKYLDLFRLAYSRLHLIEETEDDMVARRWLSRYGILNPPFITVADPLYKLVEPCDCPIRDGYAL
ncbi:hypothetical protein M422DRAFT_276960 [Sphaerobolus stellatus SS14]|uniref:Uncharacterized protein n=1 Tax=Sphaerobolus stellatus (strain SS14) TaxID=990650 RepID=A0A0C9UBV2_SPHS4|nr:hypothetical protein M422DRAFT_276960 [Sphaerobolus stellatus SS14]